jgi:predicted RNA-binding protein with PIN domain
MHIIIDGYNLIRQSPSLWPFEERSLEEGRTELLRRLSAFKKDRGHRITVVFDGWISGSSKEERLTEHGITVIFSKRGEQADEVIKRMVRHGRSSIVVVTSDRSIADTATRCGGTAISSPEFDLRLTMPSGNATSFTDDLTDYDDEQVRLTGKRKGPSKRMPKKQRRVMARLKKI